MPMTIYTIGHGTRPIDEFLAILDAHGILHLVDVRTAPGSRRNPQFGKQELESALNDHGVRYTHLSSLGGFRKSQPDSPNCGWRNGAFRGYADYMATDEFRVGLETLLEFATESPTAIMCAEAVPWRCHRSLIADALLARGVEVIDVMSLANSRPHVLTSFARVDGERVTYPAGTSDVEGDGLGTTSHPNRSR
ncbi:MAG: DNA repair protein [Chloroflexi bacterium]|nr:MAG: DNA repair protein [Chloroflexota bacterium]